MFSMLTTVNNVACITLFNLQQARKFLALFFTRAIFLLRFSFDGCERVES
jgi:hypothetical protein